MEHKFFREMLDEKAQETVRALLEQESAQPTEDPQIRGSVAYLGENRADRRARERRERRAAKQRQPA